MIRSLLLYIQIPTANVDLFSIVFEFDIHLNSEQIING
jgi:hypothetical protein